MVLRLGSLDFNGNIREVKLPEDKKVKCIAGTFKNILALSGRCTHYV